MSEVYLLRHAPVILPKGICYGASDIAIDRDSAHRMAAVCLSQLPSSVRVVCSDRARSLQTLSILAMHGLAIKERIDVEPSLNEQDMGAFEGLSYDRAANIWGTTYWAFWEDTVWHAAPSGESYLQMARRVWHGLAKAPLTGRHPVLVICHAGPLRAMSAALQGQSLADSQLMEIGHMMPIARDAVRLQTACKEALINSELTDARD